MTSVTDILVFISLSLFFWSGWKKGLLKTLSGPICLVIGSILGWLYYANTKNLIGSLVISIIAPFMLNFVISWIINASNKNEKPHFSLGRLIGGFLSLLWNGGMLALVIITIGLLPINKLGFKNIQKDVRHSNTFAVFNSFLGNRLNTGNEQVKKIMEVFEDPEKIKKIHANEKYQQIISQEKIKNLLADETTVKQIQDKDILQLMSNPKIQSIVQDPQLLDKLIELNKDIMKEGLSPAKEEDKAHDVQPPKIIELAPNNLQPATP